MSVQPKRILVIDDSADDFWLFQRAVQQSALPLQLEWLDSLLRAAERLVAAPLNPPCLILLDYRVPRRDLALGFIRRARAEAVWDRIPIVLFTDAMPQRDLEKAYELGATSCVLKPADCADLRATITSLFQRFAIIEGAKA